jgi:membrane fusion protein, multidrug efflux system
MSAPQSRQLCWRHALTAMVLALVAVASAGCGSEAAPSGAPPPLPVSVIKVEPRPVTVYDEYVAQTAAPKTIEIRSQVTGLLKRQAFEDGQRVGKGDLLYVIDERPFVSALDQAKANLAQAQANLANAQQTADRYKQLLEEKFISGQAYDSAAAQARAAAAAVDAQQALLREARINLDYTQIRAPSDGYISQSLVNPGGLVTKQDTLLTTLYSNDPLYVYFRISEDRLLELQRRLKHPPGEQPDAAPPFHVYLADGSEYKYPRRLNFVDAAVDPKTGTLQVRLAVPNPDRFLRPGLFVRVRVPALEKVAITVPQKAVMELQDLKTVYVVGADDKPQQRTIVAGYRVGNDWVVDNGLKPGDQVIVEGLEKLEQRPGTPIKPVLVAQKEHAAAPAPPSAASRPPTTADKTGSH